MDRVVYSEEAMRVKKYVIQFQDENGGWIDSSAPEARTLTVARTYLDAMPVAPYPYRIVERVL